MKGQSGAAQLFSSRESWCLTCLPRFLLELQEASQAPAMFIDVLRPSEDSQAAPCTMLIDVLSSVGQVTSRSMQARRMRPLSTVSGHWMRF